MPTRILYRFVLLLLFPVSTQVKGQEIRMEYQLEEGHSYFLDVEIRQNTHSETVSREEINMYSHLLLLFRADTVSATGSTHFTVSYRDLKLSVLAPSLGLDINSETGTNRELSLVLNKLQEHSFSLAMSRWGDLIYIRGLEEFFEDMSRDSTLDGPALKTVEEAYGPHAFENLYNIFLSYFPGPNEGNHWTRDMIYYFNTKPVKMLNRYQLVKSHEDRLVVQGIGMINSLQAYEETLPIGRVESSVSGSQTYDYSLDSLSGWLRQCLLRQRLVIETRVLESNTLPRELKIPSYTETVFEVKGYVKPVEP